MVRSYVPTDYERIRREVEKAVEKRHRQDLVIVVIVSFVVGYLLKCL